MDAQIAKDGTLTITAKILPKRPSSSGKTSLYLTGRIPVVLPDGTIGTAALNVYGK